MALALRRLLLSAVLATPLLALATSPSAGAPLKLVALGVKPFGMIAPDGQASGLYVDLARMLGEESRLPISVMVVPYPRALAMIGSGEADLIVSIQNRRLDNVVRPLARAFSGDVVAVGRAGTRFDSLADLRGKVVGHIRSAEYGAAFHDDAAIRKHETSSIEQTVRMLLEGRYDAAVGFRDSMFYVLREMGLPRERLGATLELGQRDVFLSMSRRSARQADAEALARALEALRERGAIKALKERYFGGLPKQ